MVAYYSLQLPLHMSILTLHPPCKPEVTLIPPPWALGILARLESSTPYRVAIWLPWKKISKPYHSIWLANILPRKNAPFLLSSSSRPATSGLDSDTPLPQQQSPSFPCPPPSFSVKPLCPQLQVFFFFKDIFNFLFLLSLSSPLWTMFIHNLIQLINDSLKKYNVISRIKWYKIKI